MINQYILSKLKIYILYVKKEIYRIFGYFDITLMYAEMIIFYFSIIMRVQVKSNYTYFVQENEYCLLLRKLVPYISATCPDIIAMTIVHKGVNWSLASCQRGPGFVPPNKMGMNENDEFKERAAEIIGSAMAAEKDFFFFFFLRVSRRCCCFVAAVSFR